MKSEKKYWLIGIHNSEGDSTWMYRVYGTKHQVKRHLLALVKDDRKENPEGWEFGTEKIDEITNAHDSPIDGLYAVGCYGDCHYDYSAVPEQEVKILK